MKAMKAMKAHVERRGGGLCYAAAVEFRRDPSVGLLWTIAQRLGCCRLLAPRMQTTAGCSR